MNDMHHWTTAISKIVSDDSDDELILRGHRLADLIEGASFAQAVFLTMTGYMPTAGQARTLDALFTACVDHGLTAAAMISRAFASYGTSTTAAIAGGILMFGDVAGGAGNPLARDMSAELKAAGFYERVPSESDLRTVAREMIGKALQHNGRMAGFGIPVHKVDPRAPALLRVAARNDALGLHCRLLIALEAELEIAKGRKIAINIDGVVAALILDFGFPWEAAAAFVMIPRSFSMLAHHLEEKTQGTRWRHVPQTGVSYTGPETTGQR